MSSASMDTVLISLQARLVAPTIQVSTVCVWPELSKFEKISMVYYMMWCDCEGVYRENCVKDQPCLAQCVDLFNSDVIMEKTHIPDHF